MKVKIRRPKDPNSKKPVITKNAKVLGVVHSKYQFNCKFYCVIIIIFKNYKIKYQSLVFLANQAMCDYQYLPVKPCPKTGEKTCIYDKLVPSGMVSPEWLT